MDSSVPAILCDWSRMCEMVCGFWFVCHFSFAGLSHEISACWEKCPAVDQSGCEHSRLQEAHFPDHCQCFDEKTITATLVSTPTISGISLDSARCGLLTSNSRMLQSKYHPEFCGISTIASAPSLDSNREELVLWSCCHHINNYCVRFGERQLGVR